MKIWKIAQQNILSDPKFLLWFNGSKVVDDQGNPKRVFHGTNQPFEKFRHKYKGRNTQNISSLMGFFFSEDINEAKDYADYSAKNQITEREKTELMEKDYLRQIQDAERKRDFDLSEKLTLEMEDLSLGKLREEPSGQRIVAVYLKALNPLVVKGSSPDIYSHINAAKKYRYDSVKFSGIIDNPFMLQKEVYPTNQWVVFKTSQIWIFDYYENVENSSRRSN